MYVGGEVIVQEAEVRVIYVCSGNVLASQFTQVCNPSTGDLHLHRQYRGFQVAGPQIIDRVSGCA